MEIKLFVKTNQGAFDRACRRLFDGTGRAVSNNTLSCMYRSPDGNKCVVGDMLPNKYYSPEFETMSWSGIKIFYNGTINNSLLSELQGIHDAGSFWYGNKINDRGVQSLRDIAAQYDLNTKVLDKLWNL